MNNKVGTEQAIFLPGEGSWRGSFGGDVERKVSGKPLAQFSESGPGQSLFLGSSWTGRPLVSGWLDPVLRGTCMGYVAQRELLLDQV